MRKSDLKIRTAVQVKTTVGAEAPAQFSAVVCQRIYDRIANQGWRILEACDLLGSRGPDFPLIVISLYQAEYGYTYAYVEGVNYDRPQIIIAGRSHNPFELPMPYGSAESGAFQCQKVGVVTMARKVTSYIHDLRDHVLSNGPAQLRDGWKLDVDELIELAAGSSPRGLDIYAAVKLNPERN